MYKQYVTCVIELWYTFHSISDYKNLKTWKSKRIIIRDGSKSEKMIIIEFWTEYLVYEKSDLVQCTSCGKAFTIEKWNSKHISKIHGNCPECRKVICPDKTLKRHMKYFHDAKCPLWRLWKIVFISPFRTVPKWLKVVATDYLQNTAPYFWACQNIGWNMKSLLLLP